MFISYFLFVINFLALKPTLCSCELPGAIDDQQYNQYDVIAKGRVTKVLLSEYQKTIYFTVETYFKGKEWRKKIEITTPKYEGECGITPKIGEQWLMFLYAKGNGYRTIQCTRTKNLNPNGWDDMKKKIADDLKFLEAKRSANRRKS